MRTTNVMFKTTIMLNHFDEVMFQKNFGY